MLSLLLSLLDRDSDDDVGDTIFWAHNLFTEAFNDWKQNT